VVSALLQSPNFLYLPEVGVARLAEKDGVPLDPYEVASRLSYFFLGSMPDAELFVAADMDKLRLPEQVAEQARRLFKSPKARDSIISFYQQWLEISDMLLTEKDTKVFPTFTPALRTAMRDEVSAFVDNVTRTGDGKLQTVLSASFSYPSGALYEVYGLPAGAAAARTELPRGQRAGLLTLPGVLSVYAHSDQSGPVGRGFLVSEKLLCVTPPPPPDNVDATLPKPDPNSSTRERLERHRTDPTCNSCHGLMDPYGLTFEIYDAIGRYRTKDGPRTVDATATGLPNNVGDVKDAVELMGKLAVTAEVRRCVTTQWFRYGFGREEGRDDAGTLAAALAAFAKTDYTLPDLLVGMSATRGFRYRKPVVTQ
jgi:hypothetical protein